MHRAGGEPGLLGKHIEAFAARMDTTLRARCAHRHRCVQCTARLIDLHPCNTQRQRAGTGFGFVVPGTFGNLEHEIRHARQQGRQVEFALYAQCVGLLVHPLQRLALPTGHGKGLTGPGGIGQGQMRKMPAAAIHQHQACLQRGARPAVTGKGHCSGQLNVVGVAQHGLQQCLQIDGRRFTGESAQSPPVGRLIDVQRHYAAQTPWHPCAARGAFQQVQLEAQTFY